MPINSLAEFQMRAHHWAVSAFGDAVTNDKTERGQRFIEEALELVQWIGIPVTEAHQLVDYVYSRPVGEGGQETGGVLVTLAVLCSAVGIDLGEAFDTELKRIWEKIDTIRTKQAAKPRGSALAEYLPHSTLTELEHRLLAGTAAKAHMPLAPTPANEITMTELGRRGLIYVDFTTYDHAMRATEAGKALLAALGPHPDEAPLAPPVQGA